MEALTLLRRLAEQHNYPVLREACLDLGFRDPGVEVLSALADVHLGDASAGRRAVVLVDPAALTLDARVDLAAVYMALGELDPAIAILEAARQENDDHGLLLARLAFCRQQQGRPEPALALYQRSLSLRPHIAVYHNLLRLYRDRGRLVDMATCLDAAWRFWHREQADWPDDQRQIHSEHLRGMQLDLWLAQERFEVAEAWVEQQRDVLGESDWCALLSDLAERLAARDRHAPAEEWLRTGLRLYPEQLVLYEKLAQLTQLQGRTRQAIALLTRAVQVASAQDKPTEGLLVRLSAAALQSDPRLAREAAERARDQLDKQISPFPDNIAEGCLQVEVALASVEAREDDYSAAESRFQQVLEQRPDMIPALEGLGHLLMQLGRFDEAVALFERVKTIDPTRGHGALINARRFPLHVDALRRLEQLARTPHMEGSVRAGLLFQLAAAWEKRADYDTAFALVDEANVVNRRLLNYDPKAHRQHCARIRHAFPKALYEHRPGCGHETTLPLFVVGMPRSGTTLVEQIIAGHSRIHGAGELGTIPRVIAGLERWERHTGSGRRYPDCVDDLDPQVTRSIAENILKELREYAPGKDHVVDKLPHNFENIGLIKLLFPRAKIISVRRDPRDVAISNYFIDYANKHNGMGFAYQLEWIGEQLTDHSLLMHHWERVFPGEILEVRYEDIVEDPATSARRMLDYVGVDWQPQVLDFYALERPVKTASAWQVRQPLYTNSIARWRHYQQHLGPLVSGANRTIPFDPIEMVTLPEPGWLNQGVDRYRNGDLNAAEYRFKRLLGYLPEHAAARFMLGLIYLRKGHPDDGITLMELALERCPWNRHWHSDLMQAYRMTGRDRDAAALARRNDTAASRDANPAEQPPTRLDYPLCEESICSSSRSGVIGTSC
jgi:tetratricopeptide (TPR) repeat protein